MTDDERSIDEMLIGEGDEILEDRTRGFTVDGERMMRKLAERQHVNDRTTYINELLDFAMQNNAGRVNLTAKPKRFAVQIDGAGLTPEQAERALALVHVPVADKRLGRLIGLSRGLRANLADKNLANILIDTRSDEGESYARFLPNVLEQGIMPEERESNLKRAGFRLDIRRKSPERRKPYWGSRLANFAFEIPTWLRRSSESQHIRSLTLYSDIDVRLNGHRISKPYDLPERRKRVFKRKNLEGVVAIPEEAPSKRRGTLRLARNGLLKEELAGKGVKEAEYAQLQSHLLDSGVSGIISSPLFSTDLSGEIIRDNEFQAVMSAVGEEVLQLYQDVLHDYSSRVGRLRNEHSVTSRYEPVEKSQPWNKHQVRIEQDRTDILDFLSNNVDPAEVAEGSNPFAEEAMDVPLFLSASYEMTKLFNLGGWNLRTRLVPLRHILKELRDGHRVELTTQRPYSMRAASPMTLIVSEQEQHFLRQLSNIVNYKGAVSNTQEGPSRLKRTYNRVAKGSAKLGSGVAETSKYLYQGATRPGRIAISNWYSSMQDRPILRRVSWGVGLGTGAGLLALGGGEAIAAGVATLSLEGIITAAKVIGVTVGTASAGAGIPYVADRMEQRARKKGKDPLIERAVMSTMDAAARTRERVGGGIEHIIGSYVAPQFSNTGPIGRRLNATREVAGRAAKATGRGVAKSAKAGWWAARLGGKAALYTTAGAFGVGAVVAGASYNFVLRPTGRGVRAATLAGAGATKRYLLVPGRDHVLKPSISGTAKGLDFLARNLINRPIKKLDDRKARRLEEKRLARDKLKAKHREEHRAAWQERSEGLRTLVETVNEVIEQNKEVLQQTIYRSAIGHPAIYSIPMSGKKKKAVYLFPQNLRLNMSRFSDLPREGDAAERFSERALETVDELVNAAPSHYAFWLKYYTETRHRDNTTQYIGLNIENERVQAWTTRLQERPDDIVTRMEILLSIIQNAEGNGAKIYWGEHDPVVTTKPVRDKRGIMKTQTEPIAFDNEKPMAQRIRVYGEVARNWQSRKRIEGVLDLYTPDATPAEFTDAYKHLRPDERKTVIAEVYEREPVENLNRVLEEHDLPLVQEVGRKQL